MTDITIDNRKGYFLDEASFRALCVHMDDGLIHHTADEIIAIIGNSTLLSGIAHTAITGVDLKPATTGTNQFLVEVSWTDGDGNSQTTTDTTPITVDMLDVRNDLAIGATGDIETGAPLIKDTVTTGAFFRHWANNRNANPNSGSGFLSGLRNSILSGTWLSGLTLGTHSIISGLSHPDISASYSAIAGRNNGSSGSYHTVSGNGNTVSGTYNSVAGLQVEVSSNYNIAAGLRNVVSQAGNLVAGYDNTVTASRAGVWGQSNIVSGNFSSVGGFSHEVDNTSCTAFGNNHTLRGNYTSALGRNNQVLSGSYGFAAGFANLIEGNSAAALGQSNTIRGNSGFAFGRTNSITGNDGISIGRNNTISVGNDNIALGKLITSNNSNSIVIGGVGQKLGFFNAVPVTKRNGNTVSTVDDIVSVLREYGLLS